MMYSHVLQRCGIVVHSLFELFEGKSAFCMLYELLDGQFLRDVRICRSGIESVSTARVSRMSVASRRVRILTLSCLKVQGE